MCGIDVESLYVYGMFMRKAFSLSWLHMSENQFLVDYYIWKIK